MNTNIRTKLFCLKTVLMLSYLFTSSIHVLMTCYSIDDDRFIYQEKIVKYAIKIN
jgi:hypothetical protein